MPELNDIKELIDKVAGFVRAQASRSTDDAERKSLQDTAEKLATHSDTLAREIHGADAEFKRERERIGKILKEGIALVQSKLKKVQDEGTRSEGATRSDDLDRNLEKFVDTIAQSITSAAEAASFTALLEVLARIEASDEDGIAGTLDELSAAVDVVTAVDDGDVAIRDALSGYHGYVVDVLRRDTGLDLVDRDECSRYGTTLLLQVLKPYRDALDVKQSVRWTKARLGIAIVSAELEKRRDEIDHIVASFKVFVGLVGIVDRLLRAFLPL